LSSDVIFVKENIRNVKFVRVCSLVDRDFYNVYIVISLKSLFSFNAKDNTICPYTHTSRLSYNI